jgi:hypothetical protein
MSGIPLIHIAKGTFGDPYLQIFSDAIVDLAKMEVLNHNKHDLERMLQNERSERNRTHIRNRDQIL